MTSRNRTNKFVTVNRKLSPAERNDIKSLIVKPGKIGGYVRSAGRSQVWKYYGELLFQPSDAESSETVVSVDDQRHYCSVCLAKQQTDGQHGVGHLSQIQSYMLSTATSTLTDHLRSTHDIKLSKVQCTHC